MSLVQGSYWLNNGSDYHYLYVGRGKSRKYLGMVEWDGRIAVWSTRTGNSGDSASLSEAKGDVEVDVGVQAAIWQ